MLPSMDYICKKIVPEKFKVENLRALNIKKLEGFGEIRFLHAIELY
jgi:hypothetical protein